MRKNKSTFRFACLVIVVLSLLGVEQSRAQFLNTGGGSALLNEPSYISSSQSSPMPSPMNGWESKPVGARDYWGFELGLTYNWYQGATNMAYHTNNLFSTVGESIEDQNAFFSSAGSGLGFLVGATLDLPISNSLAFVGKLRYVDDATSSTDTRTQVLNGTANTTDQVTSKYTASEQYLDLEALLRFQLSPDSWYLLGGLGFSGLLSNNLDLTQNIDDAATTGNSYPETGTGFPTGVTSLAENGSLSNTYNTTRLAFKLGLGTFISIGTSGTVLTPELVADIPLTALYTSGTLNAALANSNTTLPNLWHVDLTIGIKFPFGGNEAPAEKPSEVTPQAASSSPEPDDMVNLKGTVTDRNTGKPVDADMTVIDLSNNKVVATGHTDNGNYSIPIVKKPGKYSVTADADGYIFGSTYFQIDDQGRIIYGNHDIQIAPTSSTGRTRLLIFFDFGKDVLQSSSYPELDRAVRLLKAVPTMQVEIAGYTDNVGADDYNNDLSLRRANAVRSYLVKHGIQGSRVTPKGYGKADPIASNDTDEGRAENRRVEFVVTSK